MDDLLTQLLCPLFPQPARSAESNCSFSGNTQ